MLSAQSDVCDTWTLTIYAHKWCIFNQKHRENYKIKLLCNTPKHPFRGCNGSVDFLFIIFMFESILVCTKYIHTYTHTYIQSCNIYRIENVFWKDISKIDILAERSVYINLRLFMYMSLYVYIYIYICVGIVYIYKQNYDIIFKLV